MKFIVSHSQKQHVYQLLKALKNKKFYTSLFFLNNSYFYNKLPKNLVKKRTNDFLEKKEVTSTIIPEIIFRILKKFKNPLAAYYMDRIHDNIVSILIKEKEYDLFIGYERQCLKSFKEVKKRNKITVLDLASVHFKTQNEINTNFNNILTGFKSSVLLNKEQIIKKQELVLADHIIVLSDFAYQSCLNAGIEKQKLHKLTLGIDINNFEIKENYRSENFSILLVSGLRHGKGIKDLIEVFKELNLDNCNLNIVGGGGDAYDYVINESNKNSNIKYYSFMSHERLKTMYQNSSIFVLPSYMDSWGQVVCEAMACGTPAIVSSNTGSKDIIEHGKSGFIFEVGDREKLKEYILHLYNNSSEVERIGKNARINVEKYTWVNYHKQLNKLLEKIVAK